MLESAVEVEDDETAAEAPGVDEADGDEEAEVAGVEVPPQADTSISEGTVKVSMPVTSRDRRDTLTSWQDEILETYAVRTTSSTITCGSDVRSVALTRLTTVEPGRWSDGDHPLGAGNPTVGPDREDIGDDDDADAPGERDPDVAADGLPANRARIVSTMAVTGWFSANHATGAGIVAVGTNAELMNGRKISG